MPAKRPASLVTLKETGEDIFLHQMYKCSFGKGAQKSQWIFCDYTSLQIKLVGRIIQL